MVAAKNDRQVVLAVMVECCFKCLTPNSMTNASTILPMTVIKSKIFHGSLKKF